EMPYKTPIGPTYDCGDFPKVFARATALAGYEKFEARRAEAMARLRLRGIGLACYVESSGIAPSRFAGALGARAGFYESATVRIEPDGSIRAALGTHNHGPGHATSLAQILSPQRGVPVPRTEVVEGETDVVPYGTGPLASSARAEGRLAIVRAPDKIIVQHKQIAGRPFEAAVTDDEFAHGFFSVVGSV